jgi:hypothetical protein
MKRTQSPALEDCAEQSEGSLNMLQKYHTLRSALVAALLAASLAANTYPARRGLVEQTLQAIQECMVRAPAPWPDEWKKEYIDAIRSVIKSHQDAPYYEERLEILRNGFN